MRSYILLFLFLIFTLLGVLEATYCIDRDDIDYIVVGSGASGSVIASRLTELPDVKVLLLEAGGQPTHVSKIPYLVHKALGTRVDWNYTSVPQTHCCQNFINESVPLSCGKAIGGSTSINNMVYTRGNKRDYDLWKEAGNDGWGYDDLKQYFLKLEDYRAPMSKEDAQYHSVGGPMTVEFPPYRSEMADNFLQMGNELGYPLVDYNGEYQTGFMYPPVTIRQGERWGTYLGYLKPARWRNNLIVETYAFVYKIMFDDAREHATGVFYKNRFGEKCSVKAKKEIILSAGAYNSPQLLMLSGIGPEEHLDTHKITLVKDLPGVGQNLQDHVFLSGLMFTLNQSITMNSVRLETPENLKLWERTKTGPMTVPVALECTAYLKTNFSKEKESSYPDWPDLEILFNTDNFDRKMNPASLKPSIVDRIPSAEKEICSLCPMVLRPKSRGTVSLSSSNPHDPPRIDPNLLEHEDDVDILVEAMAIIQQFAQTRTLSQFGAQLVDDGNFAPCQTEKVAGMQQYRRCFVKMFSSSAFHPSSTCKMGPDTDLMAVVDNELRVHGVKNLRVADASIMPNIPSGHPQVACMVIGEKLADMIKKGLP